jgi:hypothetical protein
MSPKRKEKKSNDLPHIKMPRAATIYVHSRISSDDATAASVTDQQLYMFLLINKKPY